MHVTLRFAICFWVPFVFVFGLLGPQSTRAEARAGAEDRGQQGKQGGSGSGPQDQGQGQGQGYGHGQGEEAAKMGGGTSRRGILDSKASCSESRLILLDQSSRPASASF